MRRCPFSLVEMIVVIGLVALVAGFIGTKGFLAVQRQRFENSVEALATRLQLASELALSCHTNVTVRLEQQQDLWQLQCEPEGNLSLGYRLALRRPLALPGIDSISWQGEELSPLILTFERDRSLRLPKGTLHVRSQAKTLETFLQLPGCPGPLARGEGSKAEPLLPPRFPQEVLDGAQAPQVD